MSQFTWKTGEGTEFEVEAIFDVDSWTGREMRTVERVNGGELPQGQLALRSLVFALSIARVVPGYTIESADAELTFGRVRAIIREMRERDQAADAATAAADEAGGDVPSEGAVLSPTKLDERNDIQPPQ